MNASAPAMAAGPGAGTGLSQPTLVSPPTSIPWVGLLAVLMGTFISTLNGRLSNFGLADIRGAVGAGFDEGAWITTAQTAAQMLITIPAVWMGAAFGPRRVLMLASMAFAVISLLTPYVTTLPALLGMQFLNGLTSGCFIPLTLSFVLLSTPPKYWALGVALYALNLELSLNISASLEGWYVEHHSWRWIFWQNVPLALIMSLCLRHGMAVKPITIRPPRDMFGLVAGGAGLALMYAALDQGNRLDWWNSGLVWGLMLAGTVLVAAFFLHEARTAHPLINLKVVFSAPLISQFVLIAFLRLTITADSFFITLFLGAVRGFRALEIGDTLVWIAVPQLIVCPLAALMLRRTDARIVGSMGFIFVSIACLMVGYNLTPLWGSEQFLPSSLLQAVGQSLALSGVVFFGILFIKPQDALTFGALLQSARLMGGEVGSAFEATWARVREQVASNLIGQHVQIGDPQVLLRMREYGEATTKVFDPVAAVARGEWVLGNVVRAAATTQAVIDGFITVGFLTSVTMLLLVFRKAAPEHPAAPKRLRRVAGPSPK
jgi:MFS transporter, DHA2 family, multidrug resistance protein